MDRLLIAAMLLAPGVALAKPVRLAECRSGKTGEVRLYLSPSASGAYVLTSRDAAAGPDARVFTGTITAASHDKLDARHHVYRFTVQDGVLEEPEGLDATHCVAQGARARCRITSVTVKLAYHGSRGPGDDGLAALQDGAAITFDNGDPQACTVYASKALTALLSRSK